MVTQNIIDVVASGGYLNTVFNSSLGGHRSKQALAKIVSDTPLNFFDHVDRARMIAGEFNYLCGYIVARNTEVGTKITFWLDRDTLSDENEFAWGFENPANAHKYKYEPHKEFKGTFDRVEQAHSTSLNLLQFSIACWFRNDNDTPWTDEGFLVNKGGTGSETAGQNLNYGIWMVTDGTIRGGFEESAGGDHYVTSPINYADGKWHHAVITYDQVNVKLYIDGNGTPVATAAATQTPDTGTNPLRIGCNSRIVADSFIGGIDEVYVWNNDLTSSEVTALHDSGTIPQTSAIVYSNKFGQDNGSLIAQIIASITTAPTGVTFSTGGPRPANANMPDIVVGTDWYYPIWYRRRILANSNDSVDNKGNFMLSVDLKRIGSFPNPEDPTDPVGNDIFGVIKLNETLAGGREWFSNWHTATTHQWTSTGTSNSNRDAQDNLVDLHCPSGNVAKVDATGDTMEAAAGSDAWRLYVNDPDKQWVWQPDLEMTVYYKAIATQGGGSGAAIPVRLTGTTEHQLEFTCSGSGHGVGSENSHSNNSIHFRKEYAHDFYGVKMRSAVKNNEKDKWIGWKHVQKRVGANAMLYQTWMDLTDGLNGGTWVKINEFLDTGNWPLNAEDRQGFLDSNEGSGKCARVDEKQVLNMTASSVYLRNDGYNAFYKKFSVREINPISDIPTTPPPPSGGGGGSLPPPVISNFNIFQTGDTDCKSMTDQVFDQMLEEDPNPEALIIAGDIQYGSNPDCLFSKIQAFDSKVLVAMGNHDKFSNYSGHFGLSKSYYSRDVGNVHILFMDSESSFSGGSAQHTFVNADLQTASQDANIDWIFVVIHKPFFSAGTNHADNEGGKTTTYGPLFNQYKVDLILQGHNHNLQRSKQIKHNTGSTPTVIDGNSSSIYKKGAGFVAITNGTGGHDSGSALYNITSSASYNQFENDNDNAITMLTFSEGSNATLTGQIIDVDNNVLDTFVIEP